MRRKKDEQTNVLLVKMKGNLNFRLSFFLFSRTWCKIKLPAMKYKVLFPFLKTLTSKKGFTLIELLVVIAIIGVLAGVVIIGVNPARRMAEARDAIRKSDLTLIQKALEVYFIKNGRYPTQWQDTWDNDMSGWDCGGSDNSDPFIPSLTSTYIAKVPHDPSWPTSTCSYRYYAYAPNSMGCTFSFYVLSADMEIPGDGTGDTVDNCYTQRWWDDAQPGGTQWYAVGGH